MFSVDPLLGQKMGYHFLGNRRLAGDGCYMLWILKEVKICLEFCNSNKEVMLSKGEGLWFKMLDIEQNDLESR